ncbi:MAG: MATE family efflux transporter [Christensenellales bacterium]
MQDLTIGSPIKKILRFTLPIFAGNVLQQLYQLIDNVIIGQFVGSDAFAAVGATYGIYFLISGIIWGITAGFTVLTAQSFGEGNAKKTRQTIGTAVWLSVIIALIITIITVVAMPGLLRLMNTPEDIYREAYSYIVIICAGTGAQILYNLPAGILRAIGNSKIPLYFLIISSLLNVVLDLLFIIPLGMGTSGAALATVLSQGISGLLCVVYIKIKVPYLHLTKKDFCFRKDLVKAELFIGIPMALQYVITSVGMLIIQSSLNLLGTLAVTAYSVGNKIDVILEQGPIAIGTAMATYSAQNFGAGKIGRIKKGVFAANTIMLFYFAVFGMLPAFAGKYLTYLFVSENVSIILEEVDLFLKIISFTGIFLGILCVYRNSVQGMGFGVVSLAGGVIELIARSVVAFVTMRYQSFAGICMGYPVAWLFAAIFFLIVYYVIMKKLKCGSSGTTKRV